MKNLLLKLSIAAGIIFSANAVMSQSSMASSPAHPNTNSGEITVPSPGAPRDNVNSTTTGGDNQPAGPDAYDKSGSRKETKIEKKDERKEVKTERKEQRTTPSVGRQNAKATGAGQGTNGPKSGTDANGSGK